MIRRGATVEGGGAAARMKLIADRVAMVRSSLRDEMVWRDGRPWVETHGCRQRSHCDQGQEPKSRARLGSSPQLQMEFAQPGQS